MKRLSSVFLFGCGVLALGLATNAQTWGKTHTIRDRIRIIETATAIPMIVTRSRGHMAIDETSNS